MKKLLKMMVLAGLVSSAQAEFTCSAKVEKGASDGAVQTGSLTWKNTGSAIAAPYVRLEAGEGVLVRFTEADAWAKSLEFLATGSDVPVSRIGASASGTVPFLCKSASKDGKLELSWTLSSFEAFPWTELGAAMRPSSVPHEAWAFALDALKSRLGTTWDTYLARFREDVDYLAELGRPVNRIDRLWQFEINLALGNDPVLPTLAAAQDAARSARGLGLSFSRAYPSALSARFSKGVFGYGWSDNYSTYAELTDEKTLVFRIPGGGLYSFTKATGSWEPEDARDRTKLTETADAYALAYQDGSVQTFSKGNMRTASIADNQGNALTFAWKGAQLQKVTHTDGQSLVFAYANGLVASVTDDCGRKTTYAYSGDLLASVTSSDGSVTKYEYRPADGTAAARALTKITYPDGTTREFAYDGDGLVASVSVNGGKEKTSIVREAGVVTVTSPNGGVTVLKTGVSGETLEATDALGGVTTNGYTEDGLLASAVSPSGLRAEIAHDALGRVTKTVSASGAATGFSYDDAFGNLLAVQDAKGQSVTYGYDKLGRGTSVSFPDGSASKVEYNAHGDVVKSTNRRGESVTDTYDALGRLTGRRWSSGRTFAYAYDARGNLTSASDSETGAVEMEYDAADRLTRIAYPNGRGFTFAYDSCGRLSKRVSLDGAAEAFSYDASGRLVEVGDGNGTAYLRNAYDAATGRLTRQTYGNGTRVDYLYDLMGRVVSIEHRDASGKVLEALQYCYDADGRCLRASSLLGEERYGYDKDGQLTSVDYPVGDDETFAYDVVGNRTSANGVAYTANKMNQYTHVGSDELTYDTDGNLVSVKDAKGTTTYAYDILNRLVAVKNAAAGIDWSCTYDALGNRVSVTDNGVTTERVYLPGSLPSVAAEYVNGKLSARHVLVGAVRVADLTGEAASSPLVESGSIRYYHADLIGLTRLTTDAAGQVTGRAAYKAFGDLRAGFADIGSAGYVGTLGVETDPTGLLFMRNRYYSSALGRFIQPDPIGMSGGDANWYRYCENVVVDRVDPVGLLSVRGTDYCQKSYKRNLSYVLPIPVDQISSSALWEKRSSFASMYHCKGNTKYTEINGPGEAVIRPDGTLETRPECMGTPNYDEYGHFLGSMLPYWICGNTEDDSTPFGRRIFDPFTWGYNASKTEEARNAWVIAEMVWESSKKAIDPIYIILNIDEGDPTPGPDDDDDPTPGPEGEADPINIGSFTVTAVGGEAAVWSTASRSMTVKGSFRMTFSMCIDCDLMSGAANFQLSVDGMVRAMTHTLPMWVDYDIEVQGEGTHTLEWVVNVIPATKNGATATGSVADMKIIKTAKKTSRTLARSGDSKTLRTSRVLSSATGSGKSSRLYGYERYVAVEGTDYSFALSADEEATVSVSGLPAGFAFASGCISGKASAVGSQTVTITTAGSDSSMTKDVIFEVIEAPKGFAEQFASSGGDVPEPPTPADGTYTTTIDGIEWTYTIENGMATLRGITDGERTRAVIPTNTTGRVVIPSSFGGCALREICYNAFWHCEQMTAVEIPDCVRKIETQSFFRCDSLERVEIPEGVTRIYLGAFFNCKSLSSVVIPKTVTFMGNDRDGNPFDACPKLEVIEVRPGNEKYKVVDGMLLTADGKTLISVPSARTTVVVPAGVEELARNAINGNTELCSLTLPESLRRITEGLGWGCMNLERLVIPAAVAELGENAFGNLGVKTVVDFMGAPPGGTDEVSRHPLTATYANPFVAEWGNVIESDGTWRGLSMVRRDGKPLEIYDDLDQAKNAAIREGKLVFLLSGADWCPYTTKLKQYVTDAGSVFADNYVYLWHDQDKDTFGIAEMSSIPEFWIFQPSDLDLSTKSSWSTIALFNCPGCPTDYGYFLRTLESVAESKPAKAMPLSLAGPGWHEVSFPVLPEGGKPEDVFAPVADKIGFVTCGSKNWSPATGGTLAALEIGKGYWVQTTSENVAWTVTGQSNPDVEIALKPGWNLIGYPLLEEGEIEMVLATALATGNIRYIYSGSRVYPGTLTTLVPGKGYWVYAEAAGTIRFDTP